MDAVGTVNGVSVHEFDLDSVDDKPWRKPGKTIIGNSLTSLHFGAWQLSILGNLKKGSI